MILTGEMDLRPSNNPWDWLGQGIYFWEQNPKRALEYAIESAKGTQFNRRRINTPFVLGTAIELGHCLNLVEPESIELLRVAYEWLKKSYAELNQPLPSNQGNNRQLDCAVIQYIHLSQKQAGKPPYDTIRCPFQEGSEVYPGANFTTRLHIQICVLNPSLIKGYFLPRPIDEFNPFIR